MRPIALALPLALSAALPAVVHAQVSISRGIALDPTAGIRILNLAGTIRVVGWDRDSLDISGKLPPGAGKFYFFGGDRRGAKFGVELPPGVEPRGDADLEVRLPSQARLWIKAASATIEIADFRGQLDINAVSGSIVIHGSPSQVSAETMDGNVEVDGAPWLHVKTGSGNIVLRGGSEDGSLATVSGRITVTNGDFVRGRMETVTGSIAYHGAIRRGSSLSLESHSGDIELAVPPSVEANFDLDAFQGSIENTLFKLNGDEARQLRGSGGHRVQISRGMGGAQVTVRNFRGKIVLTK